MFPESRTEAAGPEPSLHEKRREPRWPTRGGVMLVVEDGATFEIEGQMVDLSASGFRAAHAHPGLRNGQTVYFQHERGAGQARVMWNRIAGSQVETGFLVL